MRWTYAELYQRSLAAAERLTERGLSHGDRVAVLAGNCPDYVAVFFAAAHLGLILVPLNWRLAAAELRYQLADSAPGVLLHDRAHEPAAQQIRGETPVAAIESVAAPAAEPLTAFASSPVRDDDPLLLIYTSGTTGRPKGALLSHANCFWTNLCLDLGSGIQSDDVVLTVLPQFHVGGWNCQPLLAWWKGATVVLEASFEAERALTLIEHRRVTTMMGVPANYLFLAEQPRFETTDLSSLRYVLVGGAPMPEALLRRWQDRGVAILQGYGLTEAAPNVLCLPADDAARKLGFSGKAYPHVEVALAGAGTELVEGPGVGELLVRGPNVFSGYWRNSEASETALAGGWLHTGDIAERDQEGFYRIRDRLKDMYISGGENVYPAEVEAVLHEHPAVADAAVIGVPDERWGESGVAVVALRSPVSEAELIAHCSDRLARFKVPRRVCVVAELPRSAMNKLDKQALRRRLAEGLA